ncbi:hypothetical protein LELG_03991 [Lodderomyces elongisporus NRRL YB-4239]|uniref:Genetic interactor of prohibitin 5, mitochondrial n=1 Tax=Lodderomyces elongisporus (strain ATCC 11503 / CBS 2605 / JCM 1781 / NBRC 1676 / NRRL YB-4239) TaxID=379508 RepID=A5E304_LODEL|nr:hypothetical protein LELG_03991 [Lodderomyces elongisporus NRRL YB-4239]
MQLSYKELQRLFKRLPLPRAVLKYSSRKLKKDFRAGNATHLYQTLLYEILHKEQYKKLPHLLDTLYKWDRPDWCRQFARAHYMTLKPHWPTVHLIYELTKDADALKVYNDKLKKPFSLVEFVKEDVGNQNESISTNETLPLLKKFSDQRRNYVPGMLNEVENWYNFIQKQPTFDLAKRPFEMIYYPSKLGTPQDPVTIDGQFKKHVEYMKQLAKEHQPILKANLQLLMAQARGNGRNNSNYGDNGVNGVNGVNCSTLMRSNGNSSSSDIFINPWFYKHLKRKRLDNTVSRLVKKNINKEHVVDDMYFREIIDRYISFQFYFDDIDQKYKMSKDLF